MENDVFKLEMDVIAPVPGTVNRYFKTLKTLRQWQKRTEIENSIYVFECREYMKNKTGQWERFVIIGTTIVLLSELTKKATRLIKSEEEKMRKKNEAFEASNCKNEE